MYEILNRQGEVIYKTRPCEAWNRKEAVTLARRHAGREPFRIRKLRPETRK